jgi:hypothetical protein
MDDGVGARHAADEALLGELGEHLVGEAEGGLGDAMRKEARERVEEALQGTVGDEVQASVIEREELLQLFAAASMDDEVDVEAAGTEDAEVVIREDGLAAPSRGGVLGDEEDAGGHGQALPA